MATLTAIAALLLMAFTLRRYVYLIASQLPPPPQSPSRRFRVAVLAAFKNEQAALPKLLDALGALDYPAERLSFTLVSDGSTDQTEALLHQWAGSRSNVHVVVVQTVQGKAQALNLALSAAPPSDLIAIYDADTWPAPSNVSALAGGFEDPRVAAASGLLLPVNATESFAARYAALETWVYQMVILAGKERCGLNPPVVGSNCMYRRADLRAIGGFPKGSFSEDIELSLALEKRDFRTRWIRSAESHMLVAPTLRRFWHQRARWTSGLYRSARCARGLESWLTAAGYLDRLVFLTVFCLTCFELLHPIWIFLYFSAPAAAMITVLLRAPNTGARWVYLTVAPLMFPADIAASVTSTLRHLTGRRPEWRTGSA